MDAQLVASKQRGTSLQGDTKRLSTQVAQLSDENKRLKARPGSAKAPRKRGAQPIAIKGATVTQEAGRVKIRLSNSLLFVASCLEDENTQVLASLARIIEPIMLIVMGIIVGTVAISLFLPMFDMATVTGG